MRYKGKKADTLVYIGKNILGRYLGVEGFFPVDLPTIAGTLVTGTFDQAYVGSLDIVGGVPPFTMVSLGGLPVGLSGSISGRRINFSGTPTTATQPSLNALSLSSITGGQLGQVFSATIVGKTSGSTISSSIPGLVVSGTNITGTPLNVGSLNLTESLANASNSPRVSSNLATISASAPTPTPGAGGKSKANLYGTGLVGPAWYSGPRQMANLARYSPPQLNVAEAAPFTEKAYEGLPARYYDPVTHQIPALPAGGVSFTPHPPTEGGVVLRATLKGTARIQYYQGCLQPRANGVNPDGTKWVEWKTIDTWTGVYPAGVSPDQDKSVLGFFDGSIEHLDIRPKSEINLTTGKPLLEGDAGLLAPEFKADLISDYKVIRFMDWQNTNGTPGYVFTDELRHKSTSIPHPSYNGWTIEDCFTAMVQANQHGWINIPWAAERSYCRKLVDLYAEMVPSNFALYVETSNEIWNNLFPVAGMANDVALTLPKPGAGRNWTAADGYEGRMFAWAHRHGQHMTWIKERADELGITVGKTGRIRRVLAGHNAAPSNNNYLMAQTSTQGNVDYFATAPYFGNDAYSPPTSDVAVIHERMKLSIDDVLGLAKQTADFAAARGAGFLIYEGNSHMVTGETAISTAVHFHPEMRKIFSYYLGELERRIPGTIFMLFAHVGSIGAHGPWQVKSGYGVSPANEPRYAAWLDALDGVYTYPAIKIVNEPGTGGVETSISYTPEVRYGAGFNVPRTVTFSNWKFDGATTTPAAQGITVTSTGFSGTGQAAGVLSFDVEASDASGTTGKLTKSITISPLPAFTMDEDYRSVTTSVALSSRGWTGSSVGNYTIRDGGIRDNGYGASGVDHALGSTGLNRRMIVDVDLIAGGIVEFKMFGQSNGLFLRLAGNGTAQLMRNGGHFAHLVPAGTIAYGPSTVDWEVVNNVVRVWINGNLIGTVTIPGHDSPANSPVGFWDQAMGTNRIIRRMRASAWN